MLSISGSTLLGVSSFIFLLALKVCYLLVKLEHTNFFMIKKMSTVPKECFSYTKGFRPYKLKVLSVFIDLWFKLARLLLILWREFKSLHFASKVCYHCSISYLHRG